MIVSLMMLMMTGNYDGFANDVDAKRRLIVLLLMLSMTGDNDGYLMVLLMTGDNACFANGVGEGRKS